ncbi:hypothetical protein BS47DRAFT_1361861 [Hydnum rufescens UP504]|uniref:Uncharacterized protein n=1 Tax=Hydnum rufescens UP504 TaxID=1448309 RepID=A0A9P6DUE5_9AGAM|nr:hypothetical protein BS47DRAFT_1361861 [Hydnum rufescens UP504]
MANSACNSIYLDYSIVVLHRADSWSAFRSSARICGIELRLPANAYTDLPKRQVDAPHPLPAGVVKSHGQRPDDRGPKWQHTNKNAQNEPSPSETAPNQMGHKHTTSEMHHDTEVAHARDAHCTAHDDHTRYGGLARPWCRPLNNNLPQSEIPNDETPNKVTPNHRNPTPAIMGYRLNTPNQPPSHRNNHAPANRATNAICQEHHPDPGMENSDPAATPGQDAPPNAGTTQP